MNKTAKITSILIGTSIILMGFQNCADDLDLSQINSVSQAPQPKVNILETSTETIIEDGEGVLSVEIENFEDYTLSWEKDGELLVDETESNLILSNAKWYDAGIYVAIATDPDGNEIRSEEIALAYEALAENKTYNGGFISYEGINYRLIHNQNATVATQRALAYCQAVRGPTATRVSHNFFASNVFATIRYYTLPTAAADCEAGVGDNVAYFHGLCLRDNGVTFQFFSPYQTIVCGSQ